MLEQRAPRRVIDEVGPDELDAAARSLTRECAFLIREDSLEVDIDPMQPRREIETVGARVETGREVEDGIDALLGDQADDDFIHHRGPHDHRPRPPSALRHARKDLLAGFSS